VGTAAVNAAVNQMMVQGEVDRADGPQVGGVPLAELG
jgi:hypothetical protein